MTLSDDEEDHSDNNQSAPINNGNECIICLKLNEQPIILLTPCNHMLLCESCNFTLHSQNDVYACPICRTTVTGQILFFIIN